MNFLVKIGLSLVLAMILHGFVKTVNSGDNFKKGLKKHLLRKSSLYSKSKEY